MNKIHDQGTYDRLENEDGVVGVMSPVIPSPATDPDKPSPVRHGSLTILVALLNFDRLILGLKCKGDNPSNC